ncbi:MAG: hypothetical protein J1E06_10195 [Acutalibacter sp.]|nr:hypothetical protein [Acutalibacter sp.]
MPFKQTGNCQPVSEELAESLRLLDNSQELLRTLFLGLALEYHSLDVQRCLLLQQQDPDLTCGELPPLALQNAASLIILCVLFGFQKQTEALAQQSAQAGNCPDFTDVKLGATSILVALIRLIRMNRGGEAGTSSSGTDTVHAPPSKTSSLF